MYSTVLHTNATNAAPIGPCMRHCHELICTIIARWWGIRLPPAHQSHIKGNIAVLQHEEIREQTRAAREDIPTTVSDMVRMLAEATDLLQDGVHV